MASSFSKTATKGGPPGELSAEVCSLQLSSECDVKTCGFGKDVSQLIAVNALDLRLIENLDAAGARERHIV